jgi:hypothetical protein
MISRSSRLTVALALLLAAPAQAHPHLPGDPFSDLASDTITAGHHGLAALTARSIRWKRTDVRGGGERPAGTLEERITREDSPAGRRWRVAIEARDAAGGITSCDSIWLTAGPPIPIYHVHIAPGDSFALAYDARTLSGWIARKDTRRSIEATLALEAFPIELGALIASRLEMKAGVGLAIAVFDATRGSQGEETRLAAHVVGETRMDFRRHEHRCWLLTLALDGRPDEQRSLWIDRATRALLREETRNASGDLLEVVEAE